MTVMFRPVAQTDWPDIGRVAHEALPNAADNNQAWLEARRSLDELRRRRRQYVVQDDGEVVGYGAIEEEDDGRWRLFVVMSPERLNGAPGNRTFARLLMEAKAVGVTTLWMREEASDKAMATFVRRHEFVETQRYVTGALPVVVYERALS